MGIVIWPNYLFPFVWVAPLLILLAIQHLLGESTVFSHLSAQGWRPILLPALAGLICGFFWEMWNFYSAAQWVYSIPFVDVFYLFEMPIVGYGGYIPFGLECVVAVGFFSLARTREGRTQENEDLDHNETAPTHIKNFLQINLFNLSLITACSPFTLQTPLCGFQYGPANHASSLEEL
jgi:hypothetical protein